MPVVTEDNPLQTSTGDYPHRENPAEVTPVGRLGSGLRVVTVSRIGVRVSTSFQIFALKMSLHSGGDFLGVIFMGMSQRGYFLESLLVDMRQ